MRVGLVAGCALKGLAIFTPFALSEVEGRC